MAHEEPINYYEYLRPNKKYPNVWCSGCGIGVVMGSLIRAIDRIGLDKNDVAVVSGIGCTGRMPVYMDFNTMHTTHGRALAFATGLKISRPKLHVIVVMGDGDAMAIGGNHFLHACRRNIDMTAIVVNNWIYGMTGGQYQPHHAPERARHHRAVRQCGTGHAHMRSGCRGGGLVCGPHHGLSRHRDG